MESLQNVKMQPSKISLEKKPTKKHFFNCIYGQKLTNWWWNKKDWWTNEIWGWLPWKQHNTPMRFMDVYHSNITRQHNLTSVSASSLLCLQNKKKSLIKLLPVVLKDIIFLFSVMINIPFHIVHLKFLLLL